MPTFEQFSYKEVLAKRSQSALPNFLLVRPGTTEEILLLRLLLGTLGVQNKLYKYTINQRVNYSKIDFMYNSRISAKTVLEFFRTEGIPIDNAETYYANSIRRGNKKFFTNLLLEISNYFYQKDKGAHATAFLHLYRAVELISYCFPLHYASAATSYEKTYSSLKDFFVKVDGELSFFKNFVNLHLFNGDPLLDIHLEIKIDPTKPELQRQYFNAIKKLVDRNNSIELKASTPNSRIVISRKGLTGLIYDLRNRYFHLLSGNYHDNFSSSELSEIDLFYNQVNDIILNWISLIYLKILKTTIMS